MTKDLLKENIISSNKYYFESSVKIAQKLFDEKLYEDCINYIEKTASFAWFNFSGYYKSEALENLLLEIQKKILINSFHEKKHSKKGKVLHICSEIYTSGGHSKLIYSWIKNDNSKKHTILSTRLSRDEIREISNFYIKELKDLEHISIKSDTKIAAVKLLNKLPLNEYDIILLHIHPDEVITNIVLSQKAITTPVCFINHADHVFWLGTSISDIVLQIRESNIPIDVERRGISTERQFFLPIPVENAPELNEISTIDRNNFINILSTGTSYKYNPNERYNFLKEAYKVVEENPNAVFNVVGINSESLYAKEFQHERIILHGIISSQELTEIEKKTDIYVEGFPMASFTALLQTALRKIPFILHYDPLPLFKLFTEKKDNDIIYPKNVQEWRNSLNNLIRDKKNREQTAQKQYEYIINNFSIEIWKKRIAELYTFTENKNHSLWMTKKDKYYYGDNEKLLVTIDKKRFSHYNYTERLSLLNKIFVYRKSNPKNININYLQKKELIIYFLKQNNRNGNNY